MPEEYLKHHRKATLIREGRKLKGNFEVSLTNNTDRETISDFIVEIRKQLREFDPAKKKRPITKRAAKKAVAKGTAKKRTAAPKKRAKRKTQ